jgi:NAD(P)-dependent dehydrogenase (short-subunit alcohol dehydrogenase family)
MIFDMDISGKSILIAGATGGLGQEIVTHLADFPCSLVLIHKEKGERFDLLKGKLKKAKAQISFYQCDFTNAEEINDAIEIFFEEQNSPYAMVNLLGDPARVDWQKAQIAHMQESFLRNASAPLHSAKEFALRMKAKSLEGAIVLFSSMQGVHPFEGSLFYGVPKAALIHGAKILAKEFGGNPFIRINVIAPGVNQAGMAEESIRKGKYEKYIHQNIIPRYGNAASIAGMTLHLLDPQLYMTGQAILCDGGLTLRRDILK